MSSQEGKAISPDDTITSTPKSSNVFGNALQTWVEIDLPSLQKKLDHQGLHLKEEQKNSLISRKNLAAKTKEFRKLDDSDKLQEFKSLLKLYQNEIDNLTNKNKTVENYFFGIYRLLAEAPDPRPLLEMSLDSVLESKETTNLRQQVDKLNNELARKADYDQLKQRLLQNEQKAAETLSSRLQAKEDEFKSLIDEKQSNWLEKEKQLQNQIKKAQKQIEELRTSNEVAERQLDNKHKHDPVSTSSSASILAELDIVSRDANSSKQRIFELEKRNEELRRELSKSKNDIEINNIKDEYQKKFSEIEGENALLLANLDQTKRKLADVTKEHNAKVEANNREISRMNQEIKSLKIRLDQASDYEEIKHELQLLKQIEFGYEDESKNGMNDIDSILVERNKVLTQELAEHRSQHNDLLERIQELEANLQSSTQELRQVHMLNQKLENDLAAFQDVANTSNFNDNASLISGFSRVTRPIGGRNGSLASQGNIRSPEDASILPIITQQRDRFRERNNELEEELKKQHGLVNDLKRQVNSLKKDNEELYERTRYLASFNNNQKSQKTDSIRKYFNPKPNVDLENNQYQQLYESKLHPIERFRIREQERISSRLPPLERLFVSLTRAILATRTTRMLFMAYCLGLHIVVMCITIYAMNLNAAMIPEVGMNTSTGGIATNQAGSPDAIRQVVAPQP